MKCRKIRSVRLFCSVVLVVLGSASVASATVLNYSGSKSGSVGNTQAGASYSFNGSAYANDARSANEANIRLWGNATAKLLGVSGELASADGKVASKNNAGTLSVMVRACGYNVVGISEQFPTGQKRNFYRTYSTTFLTAKATFWVSAVPITFTGNVGGGATMDVTYTIGMLRADLQGGPNAWGSTSAKAGIGIAGFTLASVGTTAKLMDARLWTDSGVGFLAGQKRGKVCLDLQALSADFWYQVLGFPKKTVAQWSSPAVTYTLANIR